MHTTLGDSCVFIHNGDYSGDVIIKTMSKNKKEVLGEVEIDMNDLLDFMAGCIRSKKISKLEVMSTGEILGIGK